MPELENSYSTREVTVRWGASKTHILYLLASGAIRGYRLSPRLVRLFKKSIHAYEKKMLGEAFPEGHVGGVNTHNSKWIQQSHACAKLKITSSVTLRNICDKRGIKPKKFTNLKLYPRDAIEAIVQELRG